MEKEEKKLNQEALKGMAVLAMTLNHLAHVFLQEGSWNYEICVAIGYFTAVTMCYFLVEGYHHTHSKKKYGQRLLFFALTSQIPYQGALEIHQLNMLFTLFLCFLILVCQEWIMDPGKRSFCVCLLALATGICDWGGLAAAFTLLFSFTYGSGRKLLYAFAADYLLFVLVLVTEYAQTVSWELAVLHGLFGGVGILVSGVLLVFFYNGKRSVRKSGFAKWFFYLFYPLHLTCLWIVKVFM